MKRHAPDVTISVLVTWHVRRIIAAHSQSGPRGKTMMTAIIDSYAAKYQPPSEERAQLGRTLHRRRADVLAYFDHHASNGPTEAINGRLEARRRAVRENTRT